MAIAGGHRQGAGVPGDRSMGRFGRQGADAAIGERDPEEADCLSRARPAEFSAHGLRAGYLTEAARRGVSLPEAMQQSQHRSVQQAASYYNEAERRQGRAARLVE